MAFKVVQSGKELEIREVLAYLERMYDMPAGHIRSISVVGTIGEPMAITVTVYAQTEPDPLTDAAGPGAEEDARTYVEIQRAGEDAWKAPRIS